MCGLVGLHLKDEALEPRLGELLTPMLAALTTRGPDSAGIAMYGAEPPDGRLKFSLRAPGPDYPWEPLADRLAGELDDKVTVRSIANMGIVTAGGTAERFLAQLALSACVDEISLRLVDSMKPTTVIGENVRLLMMPVRAV